MNLKEGINMKLKDLTPKGIKINEAKMTPAKVHKIQKDLVILNIQI